MGASKHGMLANLGMARKLGLGFALVLLLTLAVAAIGVAALHSVGQRFDKHFDRAWRSDETRATRLVVIGQELDQAAIANPLNRHLRPPPRCCPKVDNHFTAPQQLILVVYLHQLESCA